MSEKSPFLLSFERIVLEDVQKEWDHVEELRGQIEQKRELVTIKNRQAQELLEAVDTINGEIRALDAQLSETLVIVMQKRRRSEQSLRQLVVEWEREKVVDVADRESSLKSSHKEQVSSLTKKVNKLTDTLAEKEKRLQAEHQEVVQQQQLLLEAHVERTELQKRVDVLMLEQNRGHTRTTQSTAATIASLNATDVSVASSARQADLEAQVASLTSALKVKDSQLDAAKYTSSGAGGGSSRSPSAGSTAHLPQQQLGLDGSIQTPQTSRSVSAVPSSTTGLPIEVRSLIGLELSNRRQQRGLRGVHIVDVLPGGAADEAGIKKDSNEVIIGWGGVGVNTKEDIAAASTTIVPNSFVTVDLGMPFPSNPGEFESVRKVSIFVTGKVEGHHKRKERYNIQETTSSVETTRTSTASHTMSRSERMEQFLQRH